MSRITKFKNFIKESISIEDDIDKIVDTMLDFIDEGERITFKSSTGDMTYSDYLDKNTSYQDFKPVIVSKNKTVSKFSIVFHQTGIYDNLMDILDNMKSTIGRLGEDGWVLSDFKSGSNLRGNGDKVSITFTSFEFSKLDKKNNTFELPDEDELHNEIEKLGFRVERLKISDYETELEFSSYAYDGEIPSKVDCEDKFERICDIFGFSSFDLNYRRAEVIFEY